MKNIYKFALILSLTIVFVPSVVFAHTSDSDSLEVGGTMMNYVETTSVGDDIHEEMELLMDKMIDGTLDEPGANRMVELMEEYPGPYNMMMSRVSGQNNDSYGANNGMWGGHMFGGGSWSWLMGVWSIIWLLLGVLGVVWLWKQVTKDNGKRN